MGLHRLRHSLQLLQPGQPQGQQAWGQQVEAEEVLQQPLEPRVGEEAGVHWPLQVSWMEVEGVAGLHYWEVQCVRPWRWAEVRKHWKRQNPRYFRL